MKSLSSTQTKINRKARAKKCRKNHFLHRMGNALYWFMHNEIATPLLVFILFIVLIVIAPFILAKDYLFRYYNRVNKCQK